MLRLKLVASVVPLIVVGVLARDRLLHDWRPCIAFGDTSVQLAAGPWQSPIKVSFVDAPEAAMVRVQIVDTPDMADFTLADDSASEADDTSCKVSAATRFVAIGDPDDNSRLTIHLSTEPGGDYRIYVSSRHYTAWEAAALIATARSTQQHRLAAAF